MSSLEASVHKTSILNKRSSQTSADKKGQEGMKHRRGQVSLREEAKKSEGQFLHKQSQKAINYICGFLCIYVNGNG